MAKEFKRSYMHPTRRKLADMVKTGNYDKNSQVGWTKPQESRKIGDTWEDEHHKYEKFDGYVLKNSKNSEAFQKIRDYLEEQSTCKNTECKTVRKSEKDTKLIKKSGYCINCLAEIETEIRHAGIWTEYQNYKIWTRMLVHGKIQLEQLKQAHDEAKQVHEFLNEDGTTETWNMPQPVEEMQSDIQKMLKSGTQELEDLEVLRNAAFEIVKEKRYEHYL